MSLDLGKFNAEIRARAKDDPLFARMALMFEQIEKAVNQTAEASGTDATGHISPPAPPGAINVKASGGIAHVTLTDHSERSRGLNYFVEADTDPSFSQPHVEHLSASRGRFIPLPALDDDGNPQQWYFRAYSMYPGSAKRSDHQVLGGSQAPTGVDVGGTTQLTPLASTGAGTASTTGRQGGNGFGTAQFARGTNTAKQK